MAVALNRDGQGSVDTHYVPPRRRVKMVAFTPKDAAEGGLTYNFTKTNLMYQDQFGVAPVVADGDPVGMILDDRLWGGKTLTQIIASQPELVIDGDFNVGISQVTAKRNAALSWTGNNSLTVTADGVTAEPQGWLTIATAPMQWVRVALNVMTGSPSAILRAYRSDQVTALASSPAVAVSSYVFWFMALDAVSYLSLGVNSGTGGTQFDAVSAKAIPGNHALATGTARPVWKSGKFIRFDGVDDNLLSSFLSSPQGSFVFKGTGPNNSRGIMSCSGGGGSFCELITDGGTRLGASLGTQTSVTIFAGTSIFNKLNTYALTWDGTTVKLYTGSVPVYSQPQVGVVSVTQRLTIGARNGPSIWANMDMYQAVANNRAISQAEIAALVNYWG